MKNQNVPYAYINGANMIKSFIGALVEPLNPVEILHYYLLKSITIIIIIIVFSFDIFIKYIMYK